MSDTRIARQMHRAAQKAGPAAIEAALDAYIARQPLPKGNTNVTLHDYGVALNAPDSTGLYCARRFDGQWRAFVTMTEAVQHVAR